MGLTISGFFQKLVDRKPMKILMLGLDGAGKTTVLYKLKVGEVVTTVPTIGFNVETVEYKNVSLTVWDVGGQERIRQLWRFYLDNAQGLIFVVDCSDSERVKTAVEELSSLLAEPVLRDVVLLVLANKQDLPTAVTCQELAESLGSTLKGRQRWHVQPCVATLCHGLYEGLDWLSNQLLDTN